LSRDGRTFNEWRCRTHGTYFTNPGDLLLHVTKEHAGSFAAVEELPGEVK
jgi:hypothetical protein